MFKMRSWLRFSLGSLLLVMLVVAAFLAGRASMHATVREERRRAEAAALEMERAANFRTHRELFFEYRSRGVPYPFDVLPESNLPQQVDSPR